MMGIRADTWLISSIDGYSGGKDYFRVDFSNGRWLLWRPFLQEVNLLAEARKSPVRGYRIILPNKIAISMAHRCGLIPHGRIFTREERPDIYE